MTTAARVGSASSRRSPWSVRRFSSNTVAVCHGNPMIVSASQDAFASPVDSWVRVSVKLRAMRRALLVALSVHVALVAAVLSVIAGSVLAAIVSVVVVLAIGAVVFAVIGR